MKRGTSLYLDAVRFSAALMVFLEHLRAHTKIGFGNFWANHPYWYHHSFVFSQTAVTVFFVLSGYVIAHVLSTRERTPIEYGVSRLARLYSVVVPALLLTAVCNYLIEQRYPTAFQGFNEGGVWGVAASYLGSAAFVNRFWLWSDLEPPNTPFWTLSFEAFYYAMIAIWAFARGWGRVLGIFVLILIAGPTMVLLAPTWLLGYLSYHMARHWRISPRFSIPLWLAAIALLPFCSFLEFHFREKLVFLRIPDQSLGALLAAYAAAACFSVSILAFDAFSERVEPFLAPLTSFIRWLGSMTFALYLFHQPLLSLFTVYHLPDRSSVWQLLLLVGGTFGIVITLGRFCESTKYSYKRYLLYIWQVVASYGAGFARMQPQHRLGLRSRVQAVETPRRPAGLSE